MSRRALPKPGWEALAWFPGPEGDATASVTLPAPLRGRYVAEAVVRQVEENAAPEIRSMTIMDRDTRASVTFVGQSASLSTDITASATAIGRLWTDAMKIRGQVHAGGAPLGTGTTWQDLVAMAVSLYRDLDEWPTLEGVADKLKRTPRWVSAVASGAPGPVELKGWERVLAIAREQRSA